MDNPLSLVEHLSELRKRIIISLASVGLAAIFSFPFAVPLLKILKLPAKGVIEKLAFFSPQEAFLIYMRLAILCGLVISMPIILCQIWLFISPAVEERFKRYSVHFVIFSLASFILGGAFSFFVLIPAAVKFLLSFAGDELEPVISADKYISFISGLVIGGGLVFEMPVLSFLLAKLKVINAQFLRRKYKYAIVIIFIVTAVITPTPDAFNMLLLAAPMILLYELSIWISYFARPKLPTS